VEGNFLELAGPTGRAGAVNAQPYRPPNALRAGVAQVADTVLGAWGHSRSSVRIWPWMRPSSAA
jgi:hypothetical protein